MNLYKTALSLIICTASASARLSPDEKDSSAVMRELMAMKSEVASLKNEVASLKENNKRRGLVDMSDLDGMELTDLLDIEVDPSSGGGPSFPEIISGIIRQLYGLKRCVGFEPDFSDDRRRLSGERRLSGHSGGHSGETACFFGGWGIDQVFIGADGDIELESLNDDIILRADDGIALVAEFIGDWSDLRNTFADSLNVVINDDGPSSAKGAEIKAKVASMKETDESP